MGCLSFISLIHLFFHTSNVFVLLFFLFSAKVRPQITKKQEALIHRVLEILLEQRKWKDLVTLDTLNAFSHRRKS